MKAQLPSSRFSAFCSSPIESNRIASQDYLIGLRGILVVQSFLFVFFQTFVPAAVVDSKNTDGPLYQTLLRKIPGVLLWNESLIYSWIIFLSARTLCLPFLSNPSRQVCASSLFRRTLRIGIPTFVAFSLSAAAFSTTSTEYISDFLTLTGNVSTNVPMRFRNFLVYFNSLFDLFWLTKWYTSQAANLAFPSGTLWIVSVLFQQSYTTYMTMVTIPHTRTSWRVKAFLGFILTAWWVQSWAWYSVTGLLVADAVVNMKFQMRSREGFKIFGFRIPVWPLYLLMVVGGVLLQYLFIAWRPEYRVKELYGHTGLYTTGNLNDNVDVDQPMARDDNYLIILGVILLVETFEPMQRFFRNRVLVTLGKRSFSVFLIQPIIIYAVGIKLFMHLDATGMKHPVATFLCFLISALLVAATSEVFHRAVDVPSKIIAHHTWAWVKN